MATPSTRWKRYGGFGIATIGFLLTRIFVAETISVNMPLSFLLVSLPPLLIGLGVTVFRCDPCCRPVFANVRPHSHHLV
jgi:hypothetical protein